MIEIWIRSYGGDISLPLEEGAINYRHNDKAEYLGIIQQLYAQMMGWA